MKQVLLILLLSIFFCDIHSEEVAGVVVDENNRPLPYSTIRIKKKKIATLGDRSGRFSISSGSICPNDTISVTYIGYEPLEIGVGKDMDSVRVLKLNPSPTLLNEVSVCATSKIKQKTKRKGKKHSWSLIKTCITGKTAGDTYGYEFHTSKNKQLLLDKVGFYYCEGNNQVTEMNFRINVYDMSQVKTEPTRDFINILESPIYFEYKLGDDPNGKFEFQLPEPVVLPDNAMIEIEFLENLDDENFWFKCNLVGGSTWSKLFTENIWIKTPFSTPFFVECIELDK
ncbi:MAG: carboxypeptidase-like regulatory domain-containing protein [Muribaculaceae bacterium]|nr:carboxypeptidase-like regulatory domain-containing protein [Muribaculaceae bacterium]